MYLYFKILNNYPPSCFRIVDTIALDSNFIDHFAIYNVHGDLGNGFHILIISSLIGKNRERWLRESFVN